MINDESANGFGETETNQITFDARQGRAKLLLLWLFQLSQAQSNNDYNGWLKSLKSLYYLCFAYVKNDVAENVKEEMVKTEKILQYYNQKKYVTDQMLINSLDKLTELSLMAYKDQFMQTTSKEGGAFDASKFDGD